MPDNDEPIWLAWAKKLNAIAQAGLAYSTDRFDRERFHQIQDLSVEIVNRYTEVEETKIRDLFTGEKGYPTPKIDVRAAVFREERILLVRESSDGLWTLPGGWADIDTSLAEAVKREAWEEAGAKVAPRRIIAVLDRRLHNKPPMPFGIYKIFVECHLLTMTFQENPETLEAGWFPLDALPPLSTRRNTREQIEMCFRAGQEETHEAIFD
jgi:ADP-ribose pyrophosphatase YjhB (NUDIX family)